MKKELILSLLAVSVIAGAYQVSFAAPDDTAVQRGGIVAHYYDHHYSKKGALYRKAEDYAYKGNYKSAIATCNKYIMYYGDTPEIYYLIGNIRSMQNDVSCAIKAYEKAIELAKYDVIVAKPYNDLYSELQLHFLKGTLNIKAGDYGDADADAEILIHEGDNYFAAAGYILKAEINFRKKNYDAFERNLNMAITAEPFAVNELIGTPIAQKHSHLASFISGYQNLNSGYYDAGISFLNDAIRKNKNFYLGYAYRGYAKTETRDYYEAMKDLDKAISINPHASLAYYFRAYLNEKMNNPQSAIRDYNTAMRKANVVYPYVENIFRLNNSRIVKANLAYPLYIPRPQYIPHPEYVRTHHSILPLYRRTIDGLFVY